MSLFLKIVLIAYVVIAYIIAILLVFAIKKFAGKMKQAGQPAIKVSMSKILPIALFAPISLPIVILVVLWFKNKKGL